MICHISVQTNRYNEKTKKPIYRWFDFTYSDITTIQDFQEQTVLMCDDSIQYANEVRVRYQGNLRTLVPEILFCKLIDYIETDTLDVVYPCGIGGEFGRENGIVFFFHSNEHSITPHVHVKHQGQEISVDLLTNARTGDFRSKKKQKDAMEYIRKNRKQLIEAYHEQTNGLMVYPIDL